MNHSCQLSNVTKHYLKNFQCILNEMIENMTQVRLSDSVSHDFIVQMIPHHKAAVEMSRNLLKYTTNLPLQDIALNIIKEQTESIANMEKILCSCDKVRNCERILCQYQQKMDHIMNAMFCEMKDAPVVNNINENFINEMIPHHKGAVSMSELTLTYDICPDLKPILESIITSQKKGVIQMQKLLKEGCTC